MTYLRKLYLIAVGLFLICSSQSVYAAPCPVPNVYPFTPGCPLPASQLNDAIAGRLGNTGAGAILPDFRNNIGIAIYTPTDYGAVCDDVADDSAAINAMFTAIRVAGVPFRVTSPQNKTCFIASSINATEIANLGQGSTVELRLDCRTAGTPCVDALGSRWINWEYLYINGGGLSTTSSSTLTIGTGAQSISLTPGVREWLGVGASVTIHSKANPQNNMLGTVTSFDPGAGALVVNVTSVSGSGTLSSWGVTNSPNIGIQIGRTTGFNADVMYFNRPTITGQFTFTPFYNFASETMTIVDPNIVGGYQNGLNYGIVQDGYNHWAITSAFTSVTAPVDTAQSFNENTIIGGWIQGGSHVGVAAFGGGAMWFGATARHRLIGSYALGFPYSFVLYEAGGSLNTMLDIDAHTETSPQLTDNFFLTGPQANQQLPGFKFRDHNSEASNSVFKIDTGIASVVATDLDVRIASFIQGNGVKLFDDATKWTISGHVVLPNSGNWTAPSTFSKWNGTQLCLGNNNNCSFNWVIPNNTYLQGATTAGAPQQLIGVDAANNVTIAQLGGNAVGFVNGFYRFFAKLESIQLDSNGVWAWTNDPFNANEPLDTGLSRTATGAVCVGNGTQGNCSGTITAAIHQLTGYTIASGAGQLPAAGTAGRTAFVTDQMTTCPAAGSALTAGGSAKCPVFDNGTAWVGN